MYSMIWYAHNGMERSRNLLAFIYKRVYIDICLLHYYLPLLTFSIKCVRAHTYTHIPGLQHIHGIEWKKQQKLLCLSNIHSCAYTSVGCNCRVRIHREERTAKIEQQQKWTKGWLWNSKRCACIPFIFHQMRVLSTQLHKRRQCTR